MNSIPRFVCIDCGGSKSAKNVLRCRKCDTAFNRLQSQLKPKTVPICVDCQSPLPNNKRNGLCSPCRKKRIAKTHVCEICGGQVSTTHSKRCRKCVNALGRKPVCQYCGKALVNINAAMCRECYGSRRTGENNPNWKGKSVCPSCGGQKNDNADICINCQRQKYRGLPTCKNCGEPLSRYSPQKGEGGDYCRKCYKGERTKRWNPDLTAVERTEKRRGVTGYGDWRTEVYKRDRFTCQKCGYAKGGKLAAHHIFSYKTHPDLRLDVDNGITFCRDCHIKFHRRYGQTNNTRDQLNDYLKSE